MISNQYLFDFESRFSDRPRRPEARRLPGRPRCCFRYRQCRHVLRCARHRHGEAREWDLRDMVAGQPRHIRLRAGAMAVEHERARAPAVPPGTIARRWGRGRCARVLFPRSWGKRSSRGPRSVGARPAGERHCWCVWFLIWIAYSTLR